VILVAAEMMVQANTTDERQANSRWNECTSRVHDPSLVLLFLFATVLLLAGVGCGVLISRSESDSFGQIVGYLIASIVTLFGVCLFGVAFKRSVPVEIRHAGIDVLPDLSREPICDDPLVYEMSAAFRYEIVQDRDEWRLQPDRKAINNMNRFIYGFLIAFLMSVAGVISWKFVEDGTMTWPVSLLVTYSVTFFMGALILAFFATIQEFREGKSFVLIIPENKSDIQIVKQSQRSSTSSRTSSKRTIRSKVRDLHEPRTISRDSLCAVQLCAWKQKVIDDGDRVTSLNLQAFLVLKNEIAGGYERIPILVFEEFFESARHMESLSVILDVPFIYCADAESWQAEIHNAKTRPPFRK